MLTSALAESARAPTRAARRDQITDACLPLKASVRMNATHSAKHKSAETPAAPQADARYVAKGGVRPELCERVDPVELERLPVR
jgi:hypothetical protein